MKQYFYTVYLLVLTAPMALVSAQGVLLDPLKKIGGSDGGGLLALAELLYENLLKVLIPLVFVAIVWAGFRFVVAQGKDAELTNAKKNLKNVLIGAVIILIAGALIQVLGNTITSLIAG